jgi:hypothetical protein
MPNWSSHLPRVGALVLSAVVAAAAYGVYTGQSSTSVQTTGESVANLPDLSTKAGAEPPSDRGARPTHDQPAKGAAAASSKATALPAGVPEIQAVAREVRQPEAPQAAPAPPTPDPDSDNAGGDNALDRELERVIDNGGPAAPKRPPADGKPVSGDPSIDAPVDLIDPGPRPDMGTPPEAPEPPAPAPATPASPVTPATPAAPADPDSGLDDTAAGGLDQTDLGTPVDETDQAGSTPPPPAGSTPPPPAETPAQGACAPDAAPSVSG